jgi:hypothetical protein
MSKPWRVHDEVDEEVVHAFGVGELQGHLGLRAVLRAKSRLNRLRA